MNFIKNISYFFYTVKYLFYEYLTCDSFHWKFTWLWNILNKNFKKINLCFWDLRRITLDCYGYMGQNIFCIFKLKNIRIEKKKWKIVLFCGPAFSLREVEVILNNSCELILCQHLERLVPLCSHGQVLIVKVNIEKALKSPKTHQLI